MNAAAVPAPEAELAEPSREVASLTQGMTDRSGSGPAIKQECERTSY